MRGYFLVSPYLSDKQVGIQTAHTIGEMFVQNPTSATLTDWVSNHKTIAMLSWGFDVRVPEMIERWLTSQPQYAMATFREPELNNALTCVGFVASSSMVGEIEAARRVRGSHLFVGDFMDEGNASISSYEDFVKLIAGMRLA